jgi:hypothetical protein
MHEQYNGPFTEHGAAMRTAVNHQHLQDPPEIAGWTWPAGCFDSSLDG